MRSAISAARRAWHRFLGARASSRAYRGLRYVIATAALAYVFLLSFPQALFCYEISHHNFTVYSREPLDPNVHGVLDSVEARLSTSGIYDKSLKPRIFISDSHGLYTLRLLQAGRVSS